MLPTIRLNRLDCYLQEQRESEVRRWCQKQGLDFSMPARLAFFIICPKKCCEAVNRYEARNQLPSTWVPLTPRPSDLEDAWRELVEWRHPKLDLNLLQLAIILCHDYEILFYLWHHKFLSEDDYRDASGRLVNHPFHLILALRHFREEICNRRLSLDNIRVELLNEERAVDPTAAILQLCPSKTTHQGFFASLFKRLFFWDTEPENPLMPFPRLSYEETGMASVPVTGTVLPLPNEVSSKDVNVILCTILRKLREPEARFSTVELLWQVQSDLSSRAFSLKFLQEFQYDVYYACKDEFPEDVQLLLCQLYWAVKKEQRWIVTTKDELINSLIGYPAVYSEEPYLEVCRFMPTEHLTLYVSQIRPYADDFRSWKPALSSRIEEAADALEDLQRKRTLQDHCVLSILDAVNGDARKVWGLSELPEPLKQLFPLPFQELHKKLKAEEEIPGDEQ